MNPKQTLVFVCPRCKTKSLHEAMVTANGPRTVVEDPTALPVGHRTYCILHFVGRCVACEGETYCLVRYEKPIGRTIAELAMQAEWSQALQEGKGEIQFQYPPTSSSVHSAVNTDVAEAAVEAENCLSVNAFNACGVMARRAIHSLCNDKEAKGKDLYAQLKDLKERQVITEALYEWADSLRTLGRDGAHPEFERVGKDDAVHAVELLKELIKYVYVMPFELGEARNRRGGLRGR